MSGIAKFEKVSYEQYYNDMKSILGDMDGWSDDDIKASWEQIKLPTRATTGSAGYDFYAPLGCNISRGFPVLIPTGIRVKMDEGWVLMCYPRSGLGFKYGMRLANTTGIIDADYYYSDNEGHIMAKLCSDKWVDINEGDRFMQGVFLPFGVTVDDDATARRNGGFGSTGGSVNG